MARRNVRNGRFTISAVAEMFDIHPQTLRLYEREGLIEPGRSEGRTRLYSEKDLERLEVILTLTRDMGVNLAGVEIIMDLREKLHQAVNRLDQIEELMQSQPFTELRDQLEHATPQMQALIPSVSAKLIRVKRKRR